MTVNNQDFPLTTISYGRSKYFYTSVDFSGAAYTDSPNNSGDDGYNCHIITKLNGNYVQTMFSISNGANLYISFNGTDDHLHLVNTTGAVKDYVFPHLSAMKIWVRGTGTLEVSCYVQ